MTQADAAERSGIDVRLWQRLEAGTANSTILVFYDVARALGVTPAELLAPVGRLPNPRERKPGRPRKRRGSGG
jgi:transcriptional regulator with XRE-family HTH domain